MKKVEPLLEEQEALKKRVERLSKRTARLEGDLNRLILILIIGLIVLCAVLVGAAICNADSKAEIPELAIPSIEIMEEPVIVETPPTYGQECFHRCPVCGWAAEVYPCDDGWYCECTFCGHTSHPGVMVADAIDNWNIEWEVHS